MNMRRSRFGILLALFTLVALAGGAPRAASAAAVPGPAPTFPVAQPVLPSQSATMVVQGDFNRDGDMDLACTNQGAGTISVLLGPSFTTINTFDTVTPATGEPIYLAVADFNKDGKPDLVVVNKANNSATVELNTTSTTTPVAPTFARTVLLIPSGTSPQGVAVADVNEDGLLDFATANFTSNNITVFFNNPVDPGNFAPSITGAIAAVSYPVPFPVTSSASNPVALAFGDLDRDGNPDVVVVAKNTGRIWVFTGNGGTNPYAGPPDFYEAGGNPVSIAIADVNGDLSPDVIVSPFGGASGTPVVSVFFGNGDGSLGTAPCTSGCGAGARLDLPGVGATPYGVAVGDLNGDSYPDIAIVDEGHGSADGLKVFLGNGLGCFGNTASAVIPPACGGWLPVVLIPGATPRGLGMGDVNKDGKPDLYVANSIIPNPPTSGGATLFKSTLPGATACVASPSASTCISNRTTCPQLQVSISNVVLPTLGAVRGYSVTLRLSSNLTLCTTAPASASFFEDDYLTGGAPARNTEFHVTANPDGSYTVDDAILDPATPPAVCGPTTLSGSLFRVSVTAAANTIGTGTVTVTGFTLRDCANGPLTAFPCATPATITIKRLNPQPATVLVQTQRKTGNTATALKSAGITGITVSWTLPTDPISPTSNTGIDVWRAPFLGTAANALLSGYPDYQGTAPATPTKDQLYPAVAVSSVPPWVKLTSTPLAGTSTGYLDETFPGRGFWYYLVVRVDACGNASPLLGPPPADNGTLNYHLGDVTTNPPPVSGFETCKGDNLVGSIVIGDFGQWSSIYATPDLPFGDARGCWDFGPTGPSSGPPGGVDQRPRRDRKIGFEDLIIWATNAGTVSAPQFANLPAAADHDELSVGEPASVIAGETFAVTLRLKGAGDLKGLSTQLGWDASVVEPLAVEPGDLARAQDGIVLAGGPGLVDAVVPGSDRPGFLGDGVLATVRFRARANGNPGVTIARVDGRDRTNKQLFVAGGGQPLPLQTTFAPASPNPFKDAATLSFTLAASGRAELAIYSVDGRRVRTLASGARPAGVYRLSWDGTDDGGRALPPGMFFARLLTAEGRFARPVVMIR